MQSNTQKKKNEFIIAIALIVVILLGTAVAVTAINGRSQALAERGAILSYQEGRLDSYQRAWQQGRSQGYLETETLAEYEGLINQAESYGDGWQYGYEMGRDHGYYNYYK